MGVRQVELIRDMTGGAVSAILPMKWRARCEIDRRAVNWSGKYLRRYHWKHSLV